MRQKNSSEKYIVLLDILGFRELILKNSTHYVIQLIKTTIEDSIKMGFKIWDRLDGDLEDVKNDIDFAVISDTVVIYSHDNIQANLLMTLMSARSLFCSFLLKGLPLRGAIVCGELESINEFKDDKRLNILIGKGLVSAYELEKKQNWCGCIVDQSVITNLTNDGLSLEFLIEQKIVSQFSVPMKDNTREDNVVLNWPYVAGDEILIDGEWVFGSFMAHKKDALSNQVRNKLFNTAEYYLHEKELHQSSRRLRP